MNIITGRNEVVAKVMFLHVSVILFTGGLSGGPPLDQANTTTTTPQQGEPPGPGRPTPRPGRPPLPGPGRPPSQTWQTPPGRRLQHTVNERPVRILLECILVLIYMFHKKVIGMITVQYKLVMDYTGMLDFMSRCFLQCARFSEIWLFSTQ